MWEERIEFVRGFADAITERDVDAGLALCHEEVEFFSLMAQLEAKTYRGHAGIARYFEDVAGAWDEWRIDVERVEAAPDGRVVIVMSTHMCGKGSGIPFTEHVAHIWEFKDEKLWRSNLYRDPEEALAVAGLSA